MQRHAFTRRAALMAGGALALSAGTARLALAAETGERKFVLVILRGAMDGLAAVPPYGDPDYAAFRGRLALKPPGEAGGVLPLADGFGLHPSLPFLHEAWKQKELAILHAAASPYRDRSHFDGQDVLESGGAKVYAVADGWLNRALGALPPDRANEGVALAGALPLVLRGPAPATSWAPSYAPPAEDDTVARLMDLYADDPLLKPALAQAVATSDIVGDAMTSDAKRIARGAGAWPAVADAAAKLVAAPGGPIAAVLSFDGWDTHANQGAENGLLARRFAELDRAMRSLKAGLGPLWEKTAVIVATEFGRTVRINGTGGSDHGSGSAAFALGGAVRGGTMLGAWPTLAQNRLFEGRDLAPANDLRGLFMAVLAEHWGIERRTLETAVFPDAAGVARMGGFIRA